MMISTLMMRMRTVNSVTTFNLAREELQNKNYTSATAEIVDDNECCNYEAVTEIIIDIIKEENQKD